MYEENVCMIISGVLGQEIVPLIHDMPQVNSIFIFCDDNQHHEQWAKDWSKIKGVFTYIQVMCVALKQVAQQCEHSATSISIIGSDDDVSKKNLDQLDPSFMYTQIMKEILLTITFEQQHMDEFIQHCRELLTGNEGQLKHVNQLEQTYHEQTPIWWYTYEYFLCSMLNRALRLMDADLIIKLGFFVGDLHCQIKQMHQKQFSDQGSKEHFTVYRGQGVAENDFEKMVITEGGLLSFNCFLSTSTDDKVSFSFAESSSMNPGMVGVLFVMTIDPARSSTPFASIGDVGYYRDGEGEVLFSMHTVFRIGKITHMHGNGRLFRVELTVTSDNDNDLRQLTNRIREETFPNSTGWYRLGLVLWKIGQPAKAEQVYQILLEQATKKKLKVAIYNQLGVFKQTLGKYSEAIACYEENLNFNKKIFFPNHTNLGGAYNNLGNLYHIIGNYAKALSSYEKALKSRQRSLPSNHSDLGGSYNNIGLAYYGMGDYSKALSSCERGLAIRQRSLPPNHPELAGSYNNIGLVYRHMGNYPKALSSYKKALTSRQQSLPFNHPDLASSYNSIGNVYRYMGNYPEAFSSCEKALAIRQESLSSNHPDLADSHNTIGGVYRDVGDYPKAILSYEKALAIRQQTLPSNHPDLASTYNNIGLTHKGMGNYVRAHTCFECAVDIAQRSLSASHPKLQKYRNNLTDIKKSLL